MRGERWRRQRASCGDVIMGYWVWFAGVWFWFVYWGFFFFFFDKHLCVWFTGVCFAFALYRQYWGLISLPATWWVSFLILCIDFFFFFLVENPWACCERVTSVIYWARRGLGSVTNFFFFLDFSSNFFWVFFIFYFLFLYKLEGVPNFWLRAGRMGEKWVEGPTV